MPAVEHGVAHCSRRVTHHTELFQVPVVRIVRVGDEHVAHVVQIAVVAAVAAQDRRLHQVAEYVDTRLLCEGHRRVVRHEDGVVLDGLQEAVAPGLQLGHVGADLVHGPVQVSDHRTSEPWWPSSTGDVGVQLGEVPLSDGRAEVVVSRHTTQVIAQPLSVISGYDLLMHVVEQLSPAVLVNDIEGCVEWVHQMPVPVMQVDADILAEVCHTLLWLRVSGGQARRDYYWHPVPGGDNVGDLPCSPEYLRVHELVWEGLHECRNVQTLRIIPVQHGNGEAIVEHIGIDAQLAVRADRHQVVHVTHT
ncbi:unnamed protein product [Chilo suppressalis]|uniref:Uncharacterized protein n=1 Tax=Chilo suppressalis TaxID=168631 RepID=A0ABN8B6P4_CHISP|nr:unnamed protein product [Chilo suppressalis]